MKPLTAELARDLRRVLVVDDDAHMRAALRRLLQGAGYTVEVFESGTDFLEHAAPEAPGCVILDLRMPGIDGLAVQAALNLRQCRIPLIFLTGSAEVRHAVKALREGAADFLEKPFENDDLLRRVDAVLARDLFERRARDERNDVETRLSRLSPRECEVMAHIANGLTNKEVARVLGTSHRTVEIQRTRIMEKTEAASLADLVRMVLLSGSPPPVGRNT